MIIDAQAKQALTQNNAGVVVYDTIEITHSTFNYYRVAGFEPLTHNGKTYQPDSFTVQLLDTEIGTAPEIVVTIDNIDRVLPTYIFSALELIEPIGLKFEQHIIGAGYDTTIQPDMPMYIKSATEDEQTLTLTAAFADIFGVAFPSEHYDVSRFPGLDL